MKHRFYKVRPTFSKIGFIFCFLSTSLITFSRSHKSPCALTVLPPLFGTQISVKQPTTCSLEGMITIDITGDYDNNPNSVEYAIVTGSLFSGSPAFTPLTADPFEISAGTGTLASSAGNTFTVRTRLRATPSNFTDFTYTLSAADTIKPAFANFSHVIRATATSGSCSASVTLSTPAVTDNCSMQSLVSSHSSSVYGLGVTKVYWTATDAAGNVALDSQYVGISPPEKVTRVNADTGSCYATNVNIGDFLSNSNCNGYTASNNHPSTTYPTGVTRVTWTVTFPSGKTGSYIQQVVVYDNQTPVFGNIPVLRRNADSGQCSASYILNPLAATDNCGIASVIHTHTSTQYPIGVTYVQWTATDVNGNKKSALQPVVVYDNQPPVVSQPLTIRKYADPSTCSFTTILDTPFATENCVLKRITKNRSSAVFPIGTTYVTWTAEDIYGNKKSVLQAVVVYAGDSCPGAHSSLLKEENEQNEKRKAAGNVYPNPTTGNFSLELFHLKSVKKVFSILSDKGKTIFSETRTMPSGNKVVSFDISGQSPGMYLLKIVSYKSVQIYKLMLLP